MLSEVVIAAAKNSQKRPQTSNLTVSTIFPCPYNIYRSFVGWGNLPDLEGEEILNMENGWWQEEESIKNLKRAGIIIENRQLEIEVGRSKRKGHIDGTVTLDKVRLWEHKARSMDSAQRLREVRLDRSPDIKAQVNLYMKGLRESGEEKFKALDEAIIYIKPKDTNTPFDFIVPYDCDFADMVVEWVDRVILEGWKPEPKECPFCPMCYMSEMCTGETFLDFKGLGNWSNDELVRRWRLGKQYSDFGKELVEGTRSIFKAKFEEKELQAGDTLMVGPLRVKKYITHKRSFVQDKFVKKFGALALLDVTEEQEYPGYRIDDTEEGKVE